MCRSVLILTAVLLAAGCNFAVQGIDLPGAQPGTGSGGPSGPGTTQPDMSGPPVTLPDGGADLTSGPVSTPDLMPPPGKLGEGCDPSHPCEQPLKCFQQVGTGGNSTRLPDGYCTLPCNPGPCPRDSVCTQFESGGSLCLATCGTCRTGYTCCDKDGSAVCTPTGTCG